MAKETIYCVQPFNREGRLLVPADIRHCQSRAQAEMAAERSLARAAGAIIYSVSGWGEFEVWDAPKLIRSLGEVPKVAFE